MLYNNERNQDGRRNVPMFPSKSRHLCNGDVEVEFTDNHVDPRDGVTCQSASVDFCRNTTFHGLRYIVESNSWMRRLMWILFVLGCTTAVVYQIVDRVDFYNSLPINVNVKINYNQSLQFPAITICNQNAFRASAAARHDQYLLIEHMFSRTRNISQEDLEYYNATDLSLEELYRSLAHKKEDFIVSCHWNKGECSETDFEMIFTDHGVCFIFSQGNSKMKVSSSGVESGLQLTLNVEQYEYMTGPHDAAGVKMLLHDPRESPSVHGLGQAIPTGSHAFAGVKFMVISNLPSPHGDCAHKLLSHTSYYTTEECYTDCLVKLASTRCGCRDIFMPDKNGVLPVCTLSQYYGCLKPLEDEFNERLRDTCGCPVPCQFSIFDPALSYATVSNHLVDKLLTGKETFTLRDKLLNASEVTARLDNAKFDTFTQLVNNMQHMLEELQTRIELIIQSLEEQQNRTSVIYEEMLNAYSTKERLYRFQVYAIENNFLRGREAMEERTLRAIVYGYAEYAMLIRRRITRLFEMDDSVTDDRKYELFELIDDLLRTRQELVQLAKENVTVLLNSYYNGTKIFNYRFEDISRSHNPYIVPKPLLNYSMYYNTYMRKYAPKMTEDLDLMHSVLEMFLNISSEAYGNETLNETYLNYVFERYQFSCRTFLFSKSVVYKYGLDYPVKELNERRDDFEKVWDEFRSEIIDINQNLESLITSLTDILTKTVPSFRSILSTTKDYINDSSGTLMNLADIYLAEETKKLTRNIEDVFIQIQTRGQSLNDGWDLLRKPTETIWTTIIDDEDMLEYYNYTDNLYFLRNITEVLLEWTDTFNSLRDSDVRNQLHNTDKTFIQSFDRLTQHLDSFQSSIKVDSEFVRQNFLQLDIFFRQLSYEQVTQQKAYDIFALICDIGGSMGLFIGASMLTIVEIVDLFLTQTPLFKKKEEKKMNPVA